MTLQQELPAQIVIVGTGDREMVEKLRVAHAKFPQTLGLFIGFDEPLAHRVEGGADLFLMPSRFEPCGMNQMYSQHYGTPPIANATGGLVDTISDGETGFLIRGVTVPAIIEGIGRAILAFCDPPQWKRLQANGMTRDFGWGQSARAYALIYERIRSTS